MSWRGAPWIGCATVSLRLRTAEGKLHLPVSIDRMSKFGFVRLEERATSRAARAVLEALIEVVPYRTHTILIDNGIKFAPLPKNRKGPTAWYMGGPFATHAEHMTSMPA